ncbi:MAG TPA: RHS repeat-associated core domain-containing protein, partial [Dehalococcoidia bacterium]|nr:RHS repeat-associated core domain-containing protein [Dehalococcoidia bacterium]
STYVYKGDGVRHSKTVAAVTTTFVSDVNRSLPVTLDDGARKYVWGLGLAYEVEGSNAFVYHTDGLRSVRAVSDSSGATIQTYRTDEFGVPLDTQGTSAQPFQYTGEEGDETGLVFLRARYYEPGIGRFTSRDQAPGSLARPQMLSRYPT